MPTYDPQLNISNGALVPPNPVPSAPIAPVKSPVAVLSSQAGKQVVDNNSQAIQRIESAYAGPSIVDYLNSAGKPSDFGSRSQIAGQAGIQNYTGTAEQNTALLKALRTPANSPIMAGMVEDVNQVVSAGGLTDQERAGLTGLQQTQDGLLTAAAAARAALESKDYTSMDFHTKRAEEQQKAFAESLSEYYKSVAPLRQKLAESMVPGAREQEVSKQLANVRGQIDAFKLQTEEDKFNEYQGQTLGFAGGRASEIDLRASFKNQEMLLKEKNLLTELGLEQDARKLDMEAADKQLGFIASDFELQNKIQDKLTAQEDKLFTRADALRKESKETLADIMDSMKGVDPADMTPEMQAQIEELAARSGIPAGLVTEALTYQHQRQVFDDAIKNKQLAISQQNANKNSSNEVNFSDTQVNNGAARAGVSVQEFQALPRDVQNLYISNKEVAATITDIVADTLDGQIDPDEAVELIEMENITDEAANFFLSKLPAPSQEAGGGGFWDFLGSWLNGPTGGTNTPTK